MKYRKRATLAATAAIASLIFTGCSNSANTASVQNGDSKMYIAMVSKGFQHQFWQAVKKGAEDQAKELGVTISFDGPASESEVDQQLQMLQTAIDKQPAAIAYAALDPKACIPLFDQAEEKKIPIAQFDAPCGSDYGATLAATDSKHAGAIAADHMAELIGKKGEVGIIGIDQINSTGVARRDGFVDEIKSKYPDIKVVDIQYGDGDHLKSADVTKAMIAAHPDIKGLYGVNEGAAVGMVNAVHELNLPKGKLTIVGFDSGAAQINAIKDGTMAGAITQDPIGIGKTVLQAAYDLAKGKTVQKSYDTGAYWYDKSNIDDPKISAVLYQ